MVSEITDGNAVSQDILRASVSGWENVLGSDDQPVAFSFDHLLKLPDAMLAEAVDAARGNANTDPDKDDLKNSRTSRPSPSGSKS